MSTTTTPIAVTREDAALALYAISMATAHLRQLQDQGLPSQEVIDRITGLGNRICAELSRGE